VAWANRVPVSRKTTGKAQKWVDVRLGSTSTD
jgi:hypothetical protein